MNDKAKEDLQSAATQQSMQAVDAASIEKDRRELEAEFPEAPKYAILGVVEGRATRRITDNVWKDVGEVKKTLQDHETRIKTIEDQRSIIVSVAPPPPAAAPVLYTGADALMPMRPPADTMNDEDEDDEDATGQHQALPAGVPPNSVAGRVLSFEKSSKRREKRQSKQLSRQTVTLLVGAFIQALTIIVGGYVAIRQGAKEGAQTGAKEGAEQAVKDAPPKVLLPVPVTIPAPAPSGVTP